VYPSRIARSLSSARLAQFFRKTADGYQIDYAVRRRCRFAHHDLTSDAPYPNLDLILCRNVLMFMSAALQRRVLAALHRGLEPGGFLMLGQAETVTAAAHLFVAEDAEHRLYAKQAVTGYRRAAGGADGLSPSRHPATGRSGARRRLDSSPRSG
jgi:two-component system CheB/CheR fusion protein